MKFLIYANAPTSMTGYGIQCAQLATHLTRAGHDVAVACTFGHQIGVKTWQSPAGPVTLYPSGMLENSIDVLTAHATHFFEGDLSAGTVIVLSDVWALNTGLILWDEMNVLAWAPVDHWPVPEGVLRFFHRTKARPVAMSRFGERMFIEAGLDPLYAPLAIDHAFQPTEMVTVADAPRDARELFQIPRDAFAVLMVAMNKDPFDRKNFDGAFRAFGRFWKDHKNAVLVIHTDPTGMYGGINLHELAKHSAVPPHALIFTDAYAQRIGFTTEMLAGLYTACDVLLAPSKGEGFGVPMVEAMACGTPVICSDFTAQSELVGPGWKVGGQLLWDPSQSASYLSASHEELYTALMQAAKTDMVTKAVECREFAARYVADTVFDEFWQPIVDSLVPYVPKADKPIMESVDVLVPLMREVENRSRFDRSLIETSEGVNLTVHVAEYDTPSRTYAENVNYCLKYATADWVLIVGDDVEFTPGWFEAAQKLSDRYDVIGTNDSEPGRVRNPAVANGSHADHFFVRRSYIEELGASLEGPGVLMPECYGHWYTDKEVVELAKARGVFAPCLDSIIIHHHPGYDGDEAAREADPVYMKAVDTAEADRKTWMSRVPLIAALRVK